MLDRPDLWPSPVPLWQAAPEAVAAGVSGQSEDDVMALSGPWRLLLLGDGSPTRHLQSLTGLEVTVEVIAMASDPNPGREAPAEVAELDAPLLRRQVWLRSSGASSSATSAGGSRSQAPIGAATTASFAEAANSR